MVDLATDTASAGTSVRLRRKEVRRVTHDRLTIHHHTLVRKRMGRMARLKRGYWKTTGLRFLTASTPAEEATPEAVCRELLHTVMKFARHYQEVDPAEIVSV